MAKNEILRAVLGQIGTGGLNQPFLQGVQLARQRAAQAQAQRESAQAQALKERALSLDEATKPLTAQARFMSAQTGAGNLEHQRRVYDEAPARAVEKHQRDMSRILTNKAPDFQAAMQYLSDKGMSPDQARSVMNQYYSRTANFEGQKTAAKEAQKNRALEARPQKEGKDPLQDFLLKALLQRAGKSVDPYDRSPEEVNKIYGSAMSEGQKLIQRRKIIQRAKQLKDQGMEETQALQQASSELGM